MLVYLDFDDNCQLKDFYICLAPKSGFSQTKSGLLLGLQKDLKGGTSINTDDTGGLLDLGVKIKIRYTYEYEISIIFDKEYMLIDIADI